VDVNYHFRSFILFYGAFVNIGVVLWIIFVYVHIFFLSWSFIVAISKLFKRKFENTHDRSLCIVVVLIVLQTFMKSLAVQFPSLA
jgi:glucan phosphoethanolaminetransferase (alkaline phosphatase superfamily)